MPYGSFGSRCAWANGVDQSKLSAVMPARYRSAVTPSWPTSSTNAG